MIKRFEIYLHRHLGLIALVVTTGLVIFTVLIAFSSFSQANPSSYKVVRVIDGDTLEVKVKRKLETVRLVGIDTPEVSHRDRKGECFGQQAKEKTKSLVDGQSVILVRDPHSSDRDIYSRLLRYVFLTDGRLLNAELIKGGYAYVFIYQPFNLMKFFAILENIARENKQGLWGKCRR